MAVGLGFCGGTGPWKKNNTVTGAIMPMQIKWLTSAKSKMDEEEEKEEEIGAKSVRENGAPNLHCPLKGIDVAISKTRLLPRRRRFERC